MISKAKGTQDLLPIETRKWQYVEDRIKDICVLYNYKEIRTPIFESTDLFHRSVGESSDIVSKETYTFNDRGDRSITLRPEGSAPVIRSYVENKLFANETTPTKLFYFGPMFRYERPQKGRQRQFHQFGLEAIGSNSPLMDVEVIDFATVVFKALGLKGIKVKINSIGDEESRANYRTALIEYFKKDINTLCEDCQKRYETNPLRILDCKIDADNELFRNAPKILDSLNEESREHFEKVTSYLEASGIEYEIDHNLVRGLDYYTHTVFEVISTSESAGAQNVLAGGGRYNNLIEELDGPNTPAVGFAFGLERLILALESEGKIPDFQDKIYLYLAGIGNVESKIAELLNRCRVMGLITETDMLEKGMKGKYKQAEKYNAMFMAILGEDELANNKIVVKDLETKEENTISIDDLVKFVTHSIRNKSQKRSHCGSCGH